MNDDYFKYFLRIEWSYLEFVVGYIWKLRK